MTFRCLSRPHLATLLFLAPIFLQRVFIGGSGDSYADYPGFSLNLIGYISHFALLVLAVNSSNKKTEFNQRLVLVLICLAFLSILQLLLSSEVFGISAFELSLPLIRGWLWLMAICGYFVCFFEREMFVKLFFRACKISFIFGIFCFIFYLLTNIAFGVHIARGYPRVQGFFSEPSALAIVAPAFFYYSIYRKKFVDVIIAVITIVASGSVIVYITSVFVGMIFMIKSLGFTKISGVIILICVAIEAGLPLVLNPENSANISTAAMEILKNIGEINESGSLNNSILIRVLSAIALLSESLSRYSTSNFGGGLARLVGILITIQDLRAGGLEFIGYGFNIYGYVALKKYGDIFDFGFFSFLLSSFGIFFASLGTLVLALKARSLISDTSGIGFILIPGLLATLTNSAGGLHAYSLPMLTLVWAILSGYRTRPNLTFGSA